ncbi:MAG: T9SS type A sorting domain-containing protein, partial [Chitinophagaceae bacterium]
TNNQWTTVATENGDDTKRQYAIVDNNPFQGYNQYRLRITEKNNTIVFSAIQQVYVDFTKKAFTIYPNPAIDKISVQGDFGKPSLLRLFDISGKLILQKQLVNTFTQINLPPLSPGIYLLQVNETIQKLIIL